MINVSNYNSTVPAVVTATKPLVVTTISKNEVVRNDLTLEQNLPVSVTTAFDSKADGVVRKMMRFEKRYVSANETLQTEQPYAVSCHLVVTYNSKWAQNDDLLEVVGGLLSWLLSQESETSQQNLERILRGEL